MASSLAGLEVGLDTSFLLGLLDPRDIWHPGAIEIQTALVAGGYQPDFFDCVLTEVISTLTRRLREKRRETELEGLLDRFEIEFPPERITWLFPDLPSLYSEMIALVRNSKGELNFNDALLAIACQKRAILRLVSFDADFDSIHWLQRISLPSDLR